MRPVGGGQPSDIKTPYPPASCVPGLFPQPPWDHLRGHIRWLWAPPTGGRVASVHLHTQVSFLQCFCCTSCQIFCLFSLLKKSVIVALKTKPWGPGGRLAHREGLADPDSLCLPHTSLGTASSVPPSILSSQQGRPDQRWQGAGPARIPRCPSVPLLLSHQICLSSVPVDLCLSPGSVPCLQ